MTWKYPSSLPSSQPKSASKRKSDSPHAHNYGKCGRKASSQARDSPRKPSGDEVRERHSRHLIQQLRLFESLPRFHHGFKNKPKEDYQEYNYGQTQVNPEARLGFAWLLGTICVRGIVVRDVGNHIVCILSTISNGRPASHN